MQSFSSASELTMDQLKVMGQKQRELICINKFGLSNTVKYKQYADKIVGSNLPSTKCYELIAGAFDISHEDVELLLTLPAVEEVAADDGDMIFAPPLQHCIKCTKSLTTTGRSHMTSLSYYTVGG